jgi:hypothetical protein
MKSRTIKFLFCASSLVSISSMIGCVDNDPVEEDVPESITGVTLVFTTDQGFTVTRASASDPDGEGVQNMVVDKPIDLVKNKTYVMEIELINALSQPNSPHYNVSAQVAEEGEQHMFFFGWTNELFSSPKGDGNIDARSGEVIYSGGSDSRDAKGLPLGLTTMWTTKPATGSGTFRVILKHLPAIKTQTTGTDVGETDLDVTFDLVVH